VEEQATIASARFLLLLGLKFKLQARREDRSAITVV
jgi:hypothetical protein